MPNTVTKGDIARDLIALGENTSSPGYGYTDDINGAPLVEVWNDDFHGTKATYAIEITLRRID